MDFRGDERGQPVQIGFILLFGILVLTFAGYQGYVVPNQNAQVEFQHSQEATQEMQTFREDFLNAAEDGGRFSAGFTLGTDYQPRIIALNPPPASGKLRTERPGDGRFYMNTGDESLGEICGIETDGDGGIPSNALVYQPSYNEYQNSPRVVYENTVTYNRITQNDAVTLTTEQTIIQGTDIMIPPLVGDVSEDGTERHTVDLYPGKAGVGGASGSNVTLTVPTELGVDQWEKLLEDEMVDDGRVKSVRPNDSSVDIVLENGSYDITCPVIGIGGQPGNEPTQVRGEGNEINPAAPGDIQLIGTEWSGDTVTLTFRNAAENNSFTQGRINFYDDSTGGSQNGLAELNVVGGMENPRGGDWSIGGDYESIEPTIHLEGNGATTSIEYVFEDNPNEQNHWFVTTLTLSTGEHATYFVGGSFSQDDSDSGGGSESPPSVQNGITYRGGLTTTPSNGAIQFDIENVGDNKARLNAVRITSGVNNAGQIWRTGSDSQDSGPEITVVGGENDGYKEAGNPTNVDANEAALPANGTKLQMDSNGVIARAGDDATATFFVGNFGKTTGGGFNQYRFKSLTRVTADSNWDVKVEIEFQSRDPVIYYFAES